MARGKGKRRDPWGDTLTGIVPNELQDRRTTPQVQKQRQTTQYIVTSKTIRNVEPSVGGEIKLRDRVLQEQLEKCGKGRRPNVNCRVESFGAMVAELNRRQRSWVNEMGFSGLLFLQGKTLPRNLCYWLMTRLDPFRGTLHLPNDIECPVNATQVHWVFGLPTGPGTRSIPTNVVGERMGAALKQFGEEYGRVSGCNKTLCMKKVLENCKGFQSEDAKQSFKTTFLTLALAFVLCPTTSCVIASDLLPATTVAHKAQKYNWCQLVVDKLFESGRNFAHRFYNNGYARGCGGCAYLLAIVYLDRLGMAPNKWGVFPRVRVWDYAAIRAASREDLCGKGGDYGSVGCVDAYYGKPHPLEGKDVMPFPKKRTAFKGSHKVIFDHESGGSATTSSSGSSNNSLDKPKRKRGCKDNLNPQQRKRLRKTKFHETEQQQVDGSAPQGKGVIDDNATTNCSEQQSNGSEKSDGLKQPVATHDSPGFQHLHEPTPTAASCDKSDWMQQTMGVVHQISTAYGSDNSCRFNKQLPPHGSKYKMGFGVSQDPSSPTRVNVSQFMSNTEDEMNIDILLRYGGKNITKDIDLNFNQSLSLQRPSLELKEKLVRFVFNFGTTLCPPKDGDGECTDPVMLQCGGNYATLRNCYTVLSSSTGGVDDNIIRVASCLYTKTWNKTVDSSTFRIMLDPTFAIRVLQETGPPCEWAECMKQARIVAKQYGGFKKTQFSDVFVPVLQSSHWWCAIFSINNKTIYLIDSMVVDPWPVHEETMGKLCTALNMVLSTIDQNWESIAISSWRRNHVKMDPQQDGNSCGVQMLLAIKQCAKGHLSDFSLQSPVEEERAWLLAEDVFSDLNEAKDAVTHLIQMA